MNDGVRRSLLAAKIARMQDEDATEAAGSGFEAGEPGWNAIAGAGMRARLQQVETPVSSSVLDMLIQRAAPNMLA